MSQFKAYLGDAVYADIENGMIKLTTEDGIRATNTIYLELAVYEALVAWVARIQTAAQVAAAEESEEKTKGIQNESQST